MSQQVDKDQVADERGWQGEIAPAPGYAEARSLKRELLNELRAGWERDEPVRAEDLLPRWPGNPDEDPDVAGLLLEDYCQRQRHRPATGDPPRPEEYQQRFPSHRGSLAGLVRQQEMLRSLAGASGGSGSGLSLPAVGDELFSFPRLAAPVHGEAPATGPGRPRIAAAAGPGARADRRLPRVRPESLAAGSGAGRLAGAPGPGPGGVLRYDPGLVAAYLNLGLVNLNLQRHRAALRDFDAAAARGLDGVELCAGRGIALEYLGRLREALARNYGKDRAATDADLKAVWSHPEFRRLIPPRNPKP
jgi:hypothetical protein